MNAAPANPAGGPCGPPRLAGPPAFHGRNARATRCAHAGAARRVRRARKGLTLIELLVAVAVISLLAGVAFLVFGSTLNTIRAQAAWREHRAPAADALEVLRQDLLGALVPRGTGQPPFALVPAGSNGAVSFSLRLFTARPGSAPDDWRAYGIDAVDYAVGTNDPRGSLALFRRCRPLRPGPAGAEADAVRAAPAAPLLPGLVGIDLQVYDGKNWTNAWPAGDGAGLPRAARIRLQVEQPGGRLALAATTLIPAGHRITAPARARKEP